MGKGLKYKPNHWEETLITDVAYIEDHLRKPINNAERQKRTRGKNQSDLIPYYGATGQVGWIDDFLTDGEYILIGEDGAPFFERDKDVAFISEGGAWINNHIHILKPDKRPRNAESEETLS